MRGPPVKVLYVLGFGRSGSTLLDLLVGELEGFFSCGELQSLWRESLLDGRLCGCGEPVAECLLWSKVLGGRQCSELGLSPEEVASLQADRLHLPALGPRFRRAGRSEADWHAYTDLLAALYQRIADVTGAKVIVDSSKLPTVDRALRRLQFEVYYLHLVRDPRAVAFSWMRRKQATDRTSGAEMERFGATRTAVTWMARQLAAERIRMGATDRSLLLRYEDLVAAPAESLARVAELVGEPPADTDFVNGRSANLSLNHTVSGNPIRLRTGALELREDSEWRSQLPVTARRIVSTISWPLLKHYGYA
jgi:hypothetical protein